MTITQLAWRASIGVGMSGTRVGAEVTKGKLDCIHWVGWTLGEFEGRVSRRQLGNKPAGELSVKD